MFRAISFDLFDTLVDLRLEAERETGGSLSALHRLLAERMPIERDAVASALREVDRGFRADRYARGIEVRSEERFAALAARLGLEESGLAELLTQAHMNVIRGHVVAVPHHPELLRTLRERLKVGLCSNFTHAPTARRILEECSLVPLLDSVVISAEQGTRKPRREMFEAVLTELGCSPHEMLHVGDNLDADIAGAAALGIPTVWITRRVPDPEKALASHRGPWPEWRVQDLRELIAIVS